MEKILLIMCVWKRIENLDKILLALKNQTYKNFKYVIWNNNIEKNNEIQDITNQYNLDLEIINSEKNIGGFGRFYAAKKYAKDFKKIIFFDDDQIPLSNFIEIMKDSYENNSIKSNHTFKINSNNDYWKRTKTSIKNSVANYCGTGGMILDSSIFLYDELFKCPEKYLFIEDLWLSFIAQHMLKWKLEAISAPLTLLNDGKDQYVKLKQLKSEFLTYLIQKYQWNLNKTY
jgi:hypothetical protein